MDVLCAYNTIFRGFFIFMPWHKIGCCYYGDVKLHNDDEELETHK